MTEEKVPWWVIVYSESERLRAEKAGEETVKVKAWGGPIYYPADEPPMAAR